jgi:hypothetical protein
MTLFEWIDECYPISRRCVVILDSIESVSISILVEMIGCLSDGCMRQICSAFNLAVNCGEWLTGSATVESLSCRYAKLSEMRNRSWQQNQGWSGRRESNSRSQLGKLRHRNEFACSFRLVACTST